MTTLDTPAGTGKRAAAALIRSSRGKGHVGERRESGDEAVLTRDDAAQRVDLALQERVVLPHSADLGSHLHHRFGDVGLGAGISA